MERVVVIGAGGAGKSTLARRLADVLDIPVIHLDQISFRPGWVPLPRAERIAAQQQLILEPRWIIDGNRESTLPIRLRAADTIIFLDYRRTVSTFRALKRVVLNLGKDVQAVGCPERFNLDFIKWVWRYNSVHRPKTLALIAEHAPCATLITLKAPRDAVALLRELAAGA